MMVGPVPILLLEDNPGFRWVLLIWLKAVWLERVIGPLLRLFPGCTGTG